jgi:hypothetical protein
VSGAEHLKDASNLSTGEQGCLDCKSDPAPQRRKRDLFPMSGPKHLEDANKQVETMPTHGITQTSYLDWSWAMSEVYAEGNTTFFAEEAYTKTL